MKPLYIISSSCISPQPTFGESDFFDQKEVMSSNSNLLYCIEPDFRNFINPVQIRRMSRVLKIGFSTAIDCIRRAKTETPIDAIIIGTGKGSMVDTEQFLHSIKTFQETALNPTHFIHSTYNQLNGSIALSEKINSYNVTYVHRGFSFEHSLLDASLLADEGNATQILAGSFDEMTDEHFRVKQIWGYWKNEWVESKDLLLSNTAGTIAGEGSSFYLLTSVKPPTPTVSLKALVTLYKPDEQDLDLQVNKILADNNLEAGDIDILMRGNNGDSNTQHHDKFFQEKFPDSTSLFFKHLCGEYDTAVQFGFWLSTKILERQYIPGCLYHPSELKRYPKEGLKTVLIYNNYFNINQSIILMNIS